MAKRLATILRGCISMVENCSAEGRESMVGMRCHGKVGVETFIVSDQGRYDEEV